MDPMMAGYDAYDPHMAYAAAAAAAAAGYGMPPACPFCMAEAEEGMPPPMCFHGYFGPPPPMHDLSMYHQPAFPPPLHPHGGHGHHHHHHPHHGGGGGRGGNRRGHHSYFQALYRNQMRGGGGEDEATPETPTEGVNGEDGAENNNTEGANGDAPNTDENQNQNGENEDPTEGSTNVYVSNLPPMATDNWLRQEFSKYGLITSTRVMMNHGRTRNKGYGFVQFTEPQMALDAIEGMNNTVAGGACINVKLADRDKNRGISNKPSTNVYVGNLPLHYGVSDVANLFSKFGTVSSMVVLSDPTTGNSRGVGLVRYTSVDCATTAITSMNGVVLPNHDRPLEVKYAENQQEKHLRKHGGGTGAAPDTPTHQQRSHNAAPQNRRMPNTQPLDESAPATAPPPAPAPTAATSTTTTTSVPSGGASATSASTSTSAASASSSSSSHSATNTPAMYKAVSASSPKHATPDSSATAAGGLTPPPPHPHRPAFNPHAAPFTLAALNGNGGRNHMIPRSASVDVMAKLDAKTPASKLITATSISAQHTPLAAPMPATQRTPVFSLLTGAGGSTGGKGGASSTGSTQGTPVHTSSPALVCAGISPTHPLGLTAADFEEEDEEDPLKEISEAIPELLLPPAEDNSTIYTYNLPSNITELHLYKLFAPFGAMVSAKVIPAAKQGSSGASDYGAIQFRARVDAETAVEQLNGAPFMGTVLQISHQKPRQPNLFLSS